MKPSLAAKSSLRLGGIAKQHEQSRALFRMARFLVGRLVGPLAVHFVFPPSLRGPLRPLVGSLVGLPAVPCVFPHPHAGPMMSPWGVTCETPNLNLPNPNLEGGDSKVVPPLFLAGRSVEPFCGALCVPPLLRGPLRPLAGSLRRPLFPTPMRGPLRPLRGHLRGSLRCPCVFPHTHAGPVAPPCGAACGAPCGRQCGRSVELAAALPVAPAHQDADARQDDRERHRYDSNGATGISNFGTASFKFRSGVWSRRLQI